MTLIEQIIAAKQGDKEFALFGCDTEWVACIGNQSSCTPIAEAVLYMTTEAEFYAEATTADDALAALLVKVQAG